MEMPVYLFTGLLESGKTTLIHEVVTEEDFLEPGTTLLIKCEEGEASFSEEFLSSNNIVMIEVKTEEELNAQFWKKCEREYKPTQIMIEYNGMWNIDALFESGIPEDWYVGGIYSTVNAETAELYMTNMRKMFLESLAESNLIIFNRCDENTDRQKYRRIFKLMNPEVQLAFERKDGTLFDNEPDAVPYDYSADRIEIEDMDYGVWYLDAEEHPERYEGKTIVFKARFCESSDPAEKCFIPGRHVMTCCEDDIEFLGYVCYFDEAPEYSHAQWVKIEAKFFFGACELYGPGAEGPMLSLQKIEAAAPPQQELVTFS